MNKPKTNKPQKYKSNENWEIIDPKTPVEELVEKFTEPPSINSQVLETLCSYHCTKKEICNVLAVTFKELESFVQNNYQKKWLEFYNQNSSKGKAKIRENMILLSKKSPEMAKYLSEKHLDNKQSMVKDEQNLPKVEQNSPKPSQKMVELLQKDTNFLKLKPQYRTFLLNYLVTKNGNDSVIKAGYPKASAYSQTNRLLKNANITSLIDKYTEIEANIAGDEKEQLIDELHEIKKDARNFMKYSEAISAIKQISLMRGFENSKGNPQDPLRDKNGNPIISASPVYLIQVQGSKSKFLTEGNG